MANRKKAEAKIGELIRILRDESDGKGSSVIFMHANIEAQEMHVNIQGDLTMLGMGLVGRMQADARFSQFMKSAVATYLSLPGKESEVNEFMAGINLGKNSPGVN